MMDLTDLQNVDRESVGDTSKSVIQHVSVFFLFIRTICSVHCDGLVRRCCLAGVVGPLWALRAAIGWKDFATVGVTPIGERLAREKMQSWHDKHTFHCISL